MKRTLYLLSLLLFLMACQSKKELVEKPRDIQFSWKQIPVTETNHPDPALASLIDHYKTTLDKTMNEVVGIAPEDMPYRKPESRLTNFTSDAMRQLGSEYTEGRTVDVAIMNVNGHRAAIKKGEVSIGDLYSTYSFDNQLVLLGLKGNDLNEIFHSYARLGGAGISSNVKLVITTDGRLISALVDGQPVDPNKEYIIATLDYLAEGNNGMRALKNATWLVDTHVTLRDYMIDFARALAKQGASIQASEDRRIEVIQKEQ